MAELVEFNTLSCTAKGTAKQYNHPITIEDMEAMAVDCGFPQYIPVARSGSKCGQNLKGSDFPYAGNVEITAYNAAKGIVELYTLSCNAKGVSKEVAHPISLEDMEAMAVDCGFPQYIPVARSGSKCGQNLKGSDFPYAGNVEITAYNAAKTA